MTQTHQKDGREVETGGTVYSHQAKKGERWEHREEEEKLMLVVTTKSDRHIQQDVLRELRWDSRVADADVVVEVDGGIVTLTGTADSYAKRLAAREAAHRVSGVLDVAEDIEVKSPGSPGRNDTEIARAVRAALTWDAFVPEEKIRSTVTDGFVTLEGDVSTLRERQDAEAAIRNLAGVQGVRNRILVAAVKADPEKLRESIERGPRASGGAGGGTHPRPRRGRHRCSRRKSPDLDGETGDPRSRQPRLRRERSQRQAQGQPLGLTPVRPHPEAARTRGGTLTAAGSVRPLFL
jgi:osmotically-inducible protein OsmY